MTRAFVIEFVPVDRPQRNVIIPYLVGMARSLGVEVAWLRYGVPAAERHRSGLRGVTLPNDLTPRLVSRLAEAPGAPVVFSHAPSRAFLAAVAAGSTRRTALAAERKEAEETLGIERIADDTGHWLDLLGLSPAEDAPESIFQAATPDFSFTAGNREAEEIPVLPCLVFDDPCDYRRPVAANPLYEGVDLSDCPAPVGCSFCAIPTAAPRVRGFSRRHAARQLRALDATWSPRSRPQNVRLIGDSALRNADTVFELIEEEETGAANWEFDARADTVLRAEDVLRDALDRCTGSGHRIHLSLVGIESFSQAELSRFNKGVTPAQNLAALELLLRLEEEHPAKFRFRGHGGVSMILFTPWTSLEDLQVTLATVRNATIEGLSGKLLTSRLRLTEGLPITRLARRDGLLVEGYRDPVFDTASLNLYEAELPWRFQDPAVEDACSVLVRLPQREDLAKDPLSPRIQRLVERVSSVGVGLMDTALAVVDVLREARLDSAARRGLDRVPRIEALVDAVETGILGKAGAAPGRGESATGPALTFFRPISHGPWTRDNLENLAALSAAGLKPVVKLEDAPAASVPTWVEELQLPNPRTQEVPGTGGACQHLFFGRDRAQVERAVELSRRCMDRPSGSRGEDQAEIGRLLGYPGCCVDAYRRDPSLHGKDALLHLRRRIDEPGEVIPELAPVSLLGSLVHVPCTLGCEASADIVRRTIELLSSGAAERTRHMSSFSNPWLIMLDLDGQVVELVPETEPGERFAFRVGHVALPTCRTHRISTADEVAIDGERLLFLRGGEVHLDLSGRGYLWWHRRLLQGEIWTQILRLRERIHRLDGGPPGPVLSGAVEHKSVTTLHARVSRLLDRVRLLGLGTVALDVRLEDDLSRNHLNLTVSSGTLSIRLQVAGAADGDATWFRIGDLSFSHAVNARPRSPAQRELAGAFARLIVLAAHAGLPC